MPSNNRNAQNKKLALKAKKKREREGITNKCNDGELSKKTIENRKKQQVNNDKKNRQNIARRKKIIEAGGLQKYLLMELEKSIIENNLEDINLNKKPRKKSLKNSRKNSKKNSRKNSIKVSKKLSK